MHSKLSVSASTGRERISNAGTTVEEQSRERLMSADVQGKIGEVGLPTTSQSAHSPLAQGWRTFVLQMGREGCTNVQLKPNLVM